MEHDEGHVVVVGAVPAIAAQPFPAAPARWSPDESRLDPTHERHPSNPDLAEQLSGGIGGLGQRIGVKGKQIAGAELDVEATGSSCLVESQRQVGRAARIGELLGKHRPGSLTRPVVERPRMPGVADRQPVGGRKIGDHQRRGEPSHLGHLGELPVELLDQPSSGFFD